ncbi:MAG: phage tail protein [Burkholderiaceae bacterium]|nr:phage tail protein [Burkholderiaceae bacterium]
MTDLNHYIGGDLGVSPTGDLLLASDTIEGQQRVLRRLLTNPGEYIWHTDYGAGLPQEVGQVTDARRIRGVVRSQIFNEDIVLRSPDPTILVTAIPNGVSARIQYVDSTTKKPVALNFDINR